jgi:hypothetical protein
MEDNSCHESVMMSIIAKSVEHLVEEAAMTVEGELCSRCPTDMNYCKKPCPMYQQSFDMVMSRLISVTSQWN